ncbi:MAG: hypothetical protein ACYSUX_13615, partial [Planctomycetota bacterium]
EAASFNWKWYYSAPGLVIWLILIAVLVLLKSNRNFNALFIFIPVLALSLLWWLFIKIIPMPSLGVHQFATIFQSMMIGIAVLWLTANNIEKFGNFVKFLLSMVTVVVVAGFGTLSYSTRLSNQTILFIALFVFMTFAVLMAITLSRRFCGKRYNPVRFMLWLVLWMLLFGIFATLGYFVIGSIILSSWPSDLRSVLLQVTVIGLIFGLFLYLLNLPFMILGFVNPFFRERFCACLRLKPVPLNPGQGDISRIKGQNTGTEMPEKGDSV